MSAQRGVPHQPAPDADPLVLPLEEVLDVQRCDDPSLPPGGALWVSLRGRPLVRRGEREPSVRGGEGCVRGGNGQRLLVRGALRVRSA
jgi:hypothetical protein